MIYLCSQGALAGPDISKTQISVAERRQRSVGESQVNNSGPAWAFPEVLPAMKFTLAIYSHS